MIRSIYDLSEQLNNIAPTIYSHFNEFQQAPYIIYLDDGHDSFFADNRDMLIGELFVVELYTENKEIAIEKQLESLFRSSGINFTKNPTQYIESDKYFMTSYDIKVVYKEETQ